MATGKVGEDMMGYEETVMDSAITCHCIGHCHRCQQEIAERQAKISFKAGEVKGYQTGFLEGAKVGRRAGGREVVEFIGKEFGYFTDDGLAKIIIDDSGYYGREGSISKWQAFLKEKGI